MTKAVDHFPAPAEGLVLYAFLESFSQFFVIDKETVFNLLFIVYKAAGEFTKYLSDCANNSESPPLSGFLYT